MRLCTILILLKINFLRKLYKIESLITNYWQIRCGGKYKNHKSLCVCTCMCDVGKQTWNLSHARHIGLISISLANTSGNHLK